MGTGHEPVSKQKVLNDSIHINEDGYMQAEGVAFLLNNYKHLEVGKEDSWDTVSLFLDFDSALASSDLSVSQRRVMGAVYGLQLNYMQAAALLGQSMTVIRDEVLEILEIIEAAMNGYKTDRVIFSDSVATNLDEYLYEVGKGLINPFHTNAKVITDLLNYTANGRQADGMAKATLLQRANGLPEGFMEKATEYNKVKGSKKKEVEYPYHKAVDTGKKTNSNDYFYKQDRDNGVQKHKDITLLPDSKNLSTTGAKRTVYKNAAGDYKEFSTPILKFH